MNQIVERALYQWDMIGAPYELVAARENAVFKVDGGNGSFALRLHRHGYRTDAELRSELHWMRAVSDGGVEVPVPVPSQQGDVLCTLDGTQVDVLTWLTGNTMDRVMGRRSGDERTVLFQNLGLEMARMHIISDEWSRPKEFVRVAWDETGLLGDAPLWGQFWRNPDLSGEDAKLFERFQQVAFAELTSFKGRLDYGLIHADLVPANVMVDGQKIKIIDFDDGGFGFRIFEIATALQKFASEQDYPLLRTALVAGYTMEREIDLKLLDLFLAIRAVTYVGWNIARIQETGGIERNARFIATARAMVLDWL
ncbi:MAG: phosphotransferase [Ascidiaceihabitans sp.]|uniref:phosphotransferase n=1 Tax=Ascidiaceihabitans sp. TaxID=1872644 RepID=UPI003297849A